MEPSIFNARNDKGHHLHSSNQQHSHLKYKAGKGLYNNLLFKVLYDFVLADTFVLVESMSTSLVGLMGYVFWMGPWPASRNLETSACLRFSI